MKRLIIPLFILILVISAFARTKDIDISTNEELEYRKAGAAGLVPMTSYKTHDVGQMYFTISNWGVFGSQRGDADTRQCQPFLVRSEICDLPEGTCLPSAESPACSGVEYLFQGCLWVGAVVDGDTLVSIGEDGWFQEQEMFPSRYDDDSIWVTTIYDYPDSNYGEQDFHCEYTDTATDRNFVNEDHRPLGIKITQTSSAWSYDYAKNFVFVKYVYENIRRDGRTLNDIYFGVYVDGDCGHIDIPEYAQDDVNGFLEKYLDYSTSPPETLSINLAWLADNDGDPNNEGRFDEFSATGAMAVKVLYPEAEASGSGFGYSFNWWISNTDEELDWGPTRRENFTGWDGTPETDKMKYEVMSNGEFDYDQSQILANADNPDWQAAPTNASDLQDGYDTRFLLSFGPFSVAPTVKDSIVIGFIVGEDFHIDPSNEEGSGWDPERFNYDDLGATAKWVQLVFDNGGKGPQPPPAPTVEIEINPYDVTIYWQGIEDEPDPVTSLLDFEGYRIYKADWNQDRYYTPLVQFDKINYYRYSSFVYDDALDIMRPIYSDDIYYTNEPYTVEILNTSLEYLRDTSFAQSMPIDLNAGMPPTTTYMGEEWYYYTIRDMRPGQERYIAVTAFDNGQKTTALNSLQSDKKNNANWIVPKGDGIGIEGPYVWPNPYRVDEQYRGEEGLWAEGSPNSAWTEYSRKLRFANLPSRCMIRIYTLDGDLVDELLHEERVYDEEDEVWKNQLDVIQGGQTWDMINRNDQSIVSGIYVFSVEDLDSGEISTGKFVIIK